MRYIMLTAWVLLFAGCGPKNAYEPDHLGPEPPDIGKILESSGVFGDIARRSDARPPQYIPKWMFERDDGGYIYVSVGIEGPERFEQYDRVRINKRSGNLEIFNESQNKWAPHEKINVRTNQ
jgi:hypothetical protein